MGESMKTAMMTTNDDRVMRVVTMSDGYDDDEDDEDG